MKDEMRVKIMAFLGILILFSLFTWAGSEFVNGDVGSAAAVFAIAVVMGVLSARTLMNVGRDLKKGLPLEDELSRGLKQKAAYYAYLVTLYLVLGLMWASEAELTIFGIATTSIYNVLKIIMISMTVLFFGFWKYFNMKGKR